MIDNRMKAGPIVGLYDRFHRQKGGYINEPPMARTKRHYIPVKKSDPEGNPYMNWWSLQL